MLTRHGYEDLRAYKARKDYLILDGFQTDVNASPIKILNGAHQRLARNFDPSTGTRKIANETGSNLQADR